MNRENTVSQDSFMWFIILFETSNNVSTLSQCCIYCLINVFLKFQFVLRNQDPAMYSYRKLIYVLNRFEFDLETTTVSRCRACE
jgi:hypothetical protein